MTVVLQEVSQALATTVQNAAAGVVRVEARRRLAATGIVWSADGVLVTAHHVIEKDNNIRVGLADGQTVTATLLGRDPAIDVAVLRVQEQPLAPTTLVASAVHELHVGHLVLALGRPQQTVQATLGIVSALGEAWRTPGGGQVERYVQTDVVMYPGFSGGPLVDMTGRIVGLNTSALLRGLSLTIPLTTLQRVVDMILTHGRIRRAYLGLSTQVVRLPEALAQAVGQETGLLLSAVEAGSPAEQGGLLLGDTLVALDNQPLRHYDDLLACMSAERIGTTLSVRLIRSGQVQEKSIVPGERL